jgi:AsmA-like protein
MKKLFIRLFFVLVLLVVAAVVWAHFFLDGTIKRGVETYGPKFTKVDVKLDTVNLSIFTGGCSMKGFLLGNPEGFKSKSAISVGRTAVAVSPASLLSDKIVVQTIKMEAPEITFETGLNVKENNLSKIIANLEEATGANGEKPAAQPKEKGGEGGKKLEVDEFILSGAKLHVMVTALGGKSVTLSMPDIQLKDLGKGPDGITAPELTRQVLQAVEKQAAQLAATAIADLGKGAVYMGNDATNTVNKATKSLGDLFKKK